MILEQRGSTCGIYAFFNGVSAMSAPITTDVRPLIKNMITESSYIFHQTDATTLLGEFFSAENLYAFLAQHQSLIETTLALPPFAIKIIPFEAICIPPKTFYVVPGMFAKKWYESERELHWLCVIPDGHTYRILNSSDGSQSTWSREELTQFHERLQHKQFHWPKWRREQNMHIGDEFIDVPTNRQLKKLSKETAFDLHPAYSIGQAIAVTFQ